MRPPLARHRVRDAKYSHHDLHDEGKNLPVKENVLRMEETVGRQPIRAIDPSPSKMDFFGVLSGNALQMKVSTCQVRLHIDMYIEYVQEDHKRRGAIKGYDPVQRLICHIRCVLKVQSESILDNWSKRLTCFCLDPIR